MISSVTITPALTGASAIQLHSTGNRQLTRISGLVGPPAPREITRVRPWTDGVIDQTVNLGERTITLEGELWAASGGAALVDAHSISESFSSSLLSPAKLTVTYESGEVRWCNVKLASAVELNIEGSSRMVEYQVQLRAADPRLYSTTLKTATLTAPSSGLTWSTTTSAVNAGTASTPFTIAVTAGTNALTVAEIAATVPTAYGSLVPQAYTSALFSNPSLSIVGTGVGFSVPASTTRTFYSSTRTASSLDDVSASTEFPILYPGTSTVGIKASASNVNGATCVFSWYDAYL